MVVHSKNARLGPFEVGQVKAHMSHGLNSTDIAKKVLKPGGKHTWSAHAIADAMAKIEENKAWRGDRKEGSGAQRKTTTEVDNRIYQTVLKKRGKVKVTVAHLKKVIPELRPLGDTLVEERLQEAGLKYLRRRRKTFVASMYKKPRLDYCKWIMTKQQKTLEQFAYSDGTVFFLDRSEEEWEYTQVASLGGFVWRHADRSDALYNDCVGPSAYNKAQGHPIRVWGLLSDGFLHIHVLDVGEVMDSSLYSSLVDDKLSDWMLSTKYLVQDFEKCLRTEESQHALKNAGIELVQNYPKVSQDFNAIENAWKELRERLYKTLPTHLEARDEFITRLHAAVKWLNTHRQKQLWYLCTNQWERAYECLYVTKGGRTSF